MSCLEAFPLGPIIAVQRGWLVNDGTVTTDDVDTRYEVRPDEGEIWIAEPYGCGEWPRHFTVGIFRVGASQPLFTERFTEEGLTFRGLTEGLYLLRTYED